MIVWFITPRYAWGYKLKPVNVGLLTGYAFFVKEADRFD